MESDNDFECISVLHGHSQDVKSVLWHPSKELLFSCSYDDTIRIWEDEEDDWYCKHVLKGHTSTIWDMSFDKKGDYLVSCSDDNNLIIWDTKVVSNLPQNVCTVTGYHKRTIFSVDWSNDDLIATGAADDTIRIFQKSSGENDQITCTLISSQDHAHDGDINCVRWNPNFPNILASCGDDFKVKLWEFHP